MKYTGSCHCGKVKFEVEGQFDTGMACNCSMCSRKGSLLTFVPRGALTVHADEADLATYTFNKHVIQHRFCRHCGIHPFAEGVDPKGHRMGAINLRCVDGIDLDKIKINHVDGRSF